MEGAVRSGYRAVEELLLDRGERRPILVPDLAANLLARLDLGAAGRAVRHKVRAAAY